MGTTIIAELKALDRRIQESDERTAESSQSGLRDRWEFGRKLLTLRGNKKKLPDGLLDELAQQGRNRQELQARMKFAATYPDDERLSDAIRQFPTWHAMIHRGLTNRPSGLQRAATLIESYNVADMTDADRTALIQIEAGIRRIRNAVAEMLKGVA